MFAHLRLLTTLGLLSAALPASAQWTNGQNAQFVIGQPDFDTWGLATSQNQMGLAYGIAIDTTHSKVYVCDQIAHRVLRYSYPIIANQPNAEIVFGQANFTDSTSNAGGLSGSSLQNPSELEVDATGRLWISDMSNNRVLAFDNAHLIASNKPTADKVLGQPTMSSVCLLYTSDAADE